MGGIFAFEPTSFHTFTIFPLAQRRRGDSTARASSQSNISGGTPAPPFRRDCRTTA